MASHYEMLGVAPTAATDTITKAYRKLARQMHPDKRPKHERQQATDDLAKINSAYTTLKDDEKRRIYDMQQAADGEGTSARRAPLRAWQLLPRLLRYAAVGRTAGTLVGCGDAIAELSSNNMRRLLQTSRSPMRVVFIYLKGSARTARALPNLREAARTLEGIVDVLAVDAEAEPAVWGRGADASLYEQLPLAVLVRKSGQQQPLPSPFSADSIYEAAADVLPKLPTVCSYSSLMSLRGGLGIALALPATSDRTRLRLRAYCSSAALASADTIECARVQRAQCELMDTAAACSEGIALLAPARGAEGAGSGARLYGCVRAEGADGAPPVGDTLRKESRRLRHISRRGPVFGPLICAAASATLPLAAPCARCAERSVTAARHGPLCALFLRTEAAPLVVGVGLCFWWIMYKLVPGIMKTAGLRKKLRRVARTLLRHRHGIRRARR